MTAPTEALAWHAECLGCGIVLTVLVESELTGEPVPIPKPDEGTCELCGSARTAWAEGRWVEPDEADQ